MGVVLPFEGPYLLVRLIHELVLALRHLPFPLSEHHFLLLDLFVHFDHFLFKTHGRVTGSRGLLQITAPHNANKFRGHSFNRLEQGYFLLQLKNLLQVDLTQLP